MKAARAHEQQTTTSVTPQDQRKEARDQLTLILSFFTRVDSKASALLAVVRLLEEDAVSGHDDLVEREATF